MHRSPPLPATRPHRAGAHTAPFSALLALLLATLGCSGDTSPDDAGSTEQADARLNTFLDDIFEREVAESPVRQSRMGRDSDRQGEWDDVSDAWADREVEEARADLERLRAEFDLDQLGDTARLSAELFAHDLERTIANHAFRRHFYVVDQFNGQVSDLLTVLQNNHPVDSVGDAEDYVRRVAGLGAVLEEMARQVEDRAALGVVPPSFSFPAMFADLRAMAGGAPMDDGYANALWLDFVSKLEALEGDDVTAEDRERLRAEARAAFTGPYRAGFDTLLAALEATEPAEERNQGVWSLPDGEAFYANRVRQHTTLDLTADEVHQIGLDEVARIHGEMDAIRETVGFDGDLRAFFEFVRTDPDNYFEDSDAGRQAFLEEARSLVDGIYEVVDQWFHRLPSADLEVRRVEPWRENSTSIAFYNRPSEDGTRPGIYYANLADMESVQRYVFTAITYHESVPGHHFQIALAQELPGLPKFRRFGGTNAYVEGWALYGEMLAREMGFYEEPLRDFGRLQNELWRAVRLVVDTGIHAKRWTRQQAIDYFRDTTPLSDGDVVTEVERYFVNPGQALGYKMGMLKIVELRDRARAALGDRFDIRDFHDVVLGGGALPLPLLERRVDAYIAAGG